MSVYFPHTSTPFFAALYKRTPLQHYRDRPGGGGSDEASAIALYLLIFEPKAEQIKNAAVITALSFATFENVCYLIQNGAGHFFFYFLPGIGTGAAHVICGALSAVDCICVAENMAKDCRNLRSAGSSNHLSRNL